MAPTTGTEQPYTLAMGAVWPGLVRTLSRLDVIAGDPSRLGEDDLVDELSSLQYALHLGGEHVYGLQPPPGSETAHAELVAAIGGARDATAEVAEAVAEIGADAVALLLHEWRGALFRVRLARLRLATPSPLPLQAAETPRSGVVQPLAAFLVALLGSVAFVSGATLDVWPLWTSGMVAVSVSVLLYRP